MNLGWSGVQLSNVGRELFHIVEQIPTQQYTQDLKEHFKKQKLEMVEVINKEKRDRI